MPKFKIPTWLKNFWNTEGVDKLADFLKLVEVMDVRPDFYRDGTPKIVSIDGVAATAVTDVRPDIGKRWLVLIMYGYHDDGTARVMKWQFYDGTTTITSEGISSGANDSMSIDAIRYIANAEVPRAGQGVGIVLNNDVYAQLNVVSIGSGKKGYIRGLVLEIDD